MLKYNYTKMSCILLAVDSVAFSGAEFGVGNGPIHLDFFLCTGDEDTLLDCFHRRVDEGTCSHFQDAGVRCSSEL